MRGKQSYIKETLGPGENRPGRVHRQRFPLSSSPTTIYLSFGNVCSTSSTPMESINPRTRSQVSLDSARVLPASYVAAEPARCGQQLKLLLR